MRTTRRTTDRSNGYEAVASELMARRERSTIGVQTVLTWARSLAPRAAVLDLGCGHGVPISSALMEDGFAIYGIDASPTMTAAFRDRFPRAPVACEAVEHSDFFGRTFDGIIAIGLMFLLSEAAQRELVRRAASTLNPGGRFLFTSPAESCTWVDVLTGHPSLSLGAEAYASVLAESGLFLIGEYHDEGDNHYYDAVHADEAEVAGVLSDMHGKLGAK